MSSPPRQVGPANTAPAVFEDWPIGDRYVIQKQLGKGSYGKVAEAIDRLTKQKVAIKQMKKIFREPVDAKRAYREIHILRHLKHPNIIALLDVISTAFPRSPTSATSAKSPGSVDNLSNNLLNTPLLGGSSSHNGSGSNTGSSTSNNSNRSSSSIGGLSLSLNLSTRSSPRTMRDLGDLYLVFEYMDTDLSKIIKSDQFLSTEHIQYILYQILVGLKFIHSARVIHRDIKPANILIRCDDCLTKIADFGLSRVVDESLVRRAATTSSSTSSPTTTTSTTSSSSSSSSSHSGYNMGQPSALKRGLTCHVVTRWYRAPEIILSQPYTSAVDIWSVGCILGELFGMQSENISDRQNRRPMFPGQSCGELSQGSDEGSDDVLENESGQLMVIFKTMGTPTAEDLEYLDEYTAKQIAYVKPTVGKDFAKMFPGTPPEGIDLIKRMLHFNPRRRISVEEALAHPFLAPKRIPSSEISVSRPMSVTIESVGESADHLFDNVVNELMYYR